MRNINVFSELVVVWPGETFSWVVNSAEIPTGSSSIVVSSSDWPLPDPSYTVTPGTGVSVTVGKDPGEEGTFQCNPPAPNVETQRFLVAAQAPVSVCSNVTLIPGDYFLWENGSAEPVLISPDESNENFWPLPEQEHEVPAHGWLALQVPSDAQVGEYTLVVTSANGGAVCPEAAQPKLIVQSGL
jgi:hypothetical protein